MKSLNISKLSWVFFGLVLFCLNVGQAVQRPILYNHPRVFVPGEGTIRPGSIDKISPDGTRSTVVSDLDKPSGIALDAAGNLYYGNVTSGSTIISLFKRTRDGTVMNLGEVVNTSGGSVSVSGWGFDVAVSPSGDIFYNHPRVFIPGQGTIRAGSIDKLSPEGTRSTVVSDLDRPSGIAFDAAGNLYYGNVTSGSIRISLFKRTPDGTVTNLGEVVNTSGGSFSISGWGFDVAVSPSGDIFYNHPRVFILRQGTIRPGSIDKLSPEGTRSTVVSDLDRPSGIAFDAAGNLYYGNVTSGSIRISLFKRTPDGTVTNLGEVVNTSGGSVSIVGWGFDVAIGPAIIYVDSDARGANDGSSWADAYNYLQYALTVASSGDEIRVAQGIYKPDQGVGITVGDRTATFQLISGVPVKAGYAGFGEPDPDTRNIDLYETTLSGDLNGDDGPNFANNYENSYNVVTGSGTNATAVLDGFTITAGNNPLFPNSGGGMYNYKGSPTVTNCTFIGNLADFGGGMCNNNDSSPTLTNCTFSGNFAHDGGGMYNRSHSSPTLTNCTFTGNSADCGGGMGNLWNSSPTLTNCTFSGNSVSSAGGGIWNYNYSGPTLTNCTFSGNSAVQGGGMCTAYAYHSSPTVVNCTFAGNSANYGGGMANYNSSPTLTNCILWGDSASSGGPEIYNYNSTPTVSYSDVQGSWPGIGNINADPCFVEAGYLGPVSYWKLDEGGGTTAYDSVGQNHGTVYGAQWTTGKIDGALSFDGVDDFTGIAWDESLANVADNFTILLWAQPLSTHQIDPESNSGTRGTSGQKYAISARQGDYHWGSGHAGAGISIGTNGISVYEHAAEYMPAVLVWSGSVSGFTHVAVVYSDKQPRLYIDGESKKTGLQSSKIVHILSNIGGHRYGYFNGLIDDVHFYDRALSDDEIQQHYQNGSSGQAYPDTNVPDYHLLPDSPCINAGDPDYIAQPGETDLDGKPRVIAGRIDMGAYEFNHIPVADAGPDRTVEAQAPWGATVTLDGSGSSDADSTPGTIDDINDFNWYQLDPCDPNFDVFLGTGRIIDCNLSIGEHIILLEVIDKAGASDTNEVTIIVQDTTPPDINCPPDVTLECPADTTPSATGKATATDTCGTVTITHSDQWQPSCGNAGTLARTWTATDESGNSSTCVQIITVVDTTPPVITCPADVTLECPADTSVEANGSATAGDMCGSVTIGHNDEWQPSCGNTGTLVRTWTATDECGNSSSCVQTLTVVDTTPPEFEFSVTPTMLWPPDHKMVEITPSWTISDECDASPDVSLVSIVANEGDNTIGDGHTSNDIQIGEDGSIYLRSERSGTSDDRVYTITYQAVDDCGNTSVRSAAVSIPHDFKVLARIAARWLWAGPGRIPEDLNGDGVVNLKDIAIFANNWIQ